jgi:hypothetical protein
MTSKTREQAFQDWRGIRMVDPHTPQPVDIREVFQAGWKAAEREYQYQLIDSLYHLADVVARIGEHDEIPKDWDWWKSYAEHLSKVTKDIRNSIDELISVDGGPPVSRIVYESMMGPYSLKDE